MAVGIETIILVVAIGLVMITLAVLPDMTRSLAKYAHYLFFFASLILCIIVVGRYTSSGTNSINVPSMDVASVLDGSSRDQKTKMGIAECRAFVEMKQRGEVHPSEVEPAAGGIIPINVQSASLWEVCAERFGENFWKHDTTIGGRRGGDVLCELYREGDYRSERVDTWCTTVFAPKR